MGIWFACELDSYKLHSKQVLAMEGSRVMGMLEDTVVSVGMAVGMVRTELLVCNQVLDMVLHMAGRTSARPALVHTPDQIQM